MTPSRGELAERLRIRMDKGAGIREFTAAIRQALPDAAARADEIMRERGFDSDEDTQYLWVEALADVTNTHSHERNEGEVHRELLFFSNQYERSSHTVKDCIDVSYVENLMWNLDSEDREWLWPRIPENLKSLHVAMWGGARRPADPSGTGTHTREEGDKR